ncbi:uncharacterized protein IWZ02DRAFT_254110 [Phyllosticta citriasiana]|uniref:Uncharacterized protein n=1 Tax=Phyllosticta citriasiana TaxID=595635 RepID=A0ABR1KRP4_9PEZI
MTTHFGQLWVTCTTSTLARPKMGHFPTRLYHDVSAIGVGVKNYLTLKELSNMNYSRKERCTSVEFVTRRGSLKEPVGGLYFLARLDLNTTAFPNAYHAYKLAWSPSEYIDTLGSHFPALQTLSLAGVSTSPRDGWKFSALLLLSTLQPSTNVSHQEHCSPRVRKDQRDVPRLPLCRPGHGRIDPGRAGVAHLDPWGKGAQIRPPPENQHGLENLSREILPHS